MHSITPHFARVGNHMANSHHGMGHAKGHGRHFLRGSDGYTNSRSVKPLEVLNRALQGMTGKLSDVFPGTQTDKASSTDFTPEAVAGRILDSVKDALSDISDPKEYKEKIKQAEHGIRRGIADARRDLRHLGLNTRDVNQTIRQTRELLKDGLKALKENGPVTENTRTATITTDYSLQKYSQQEQSFSLEINTRDGDRVTINFSSQQESSLDFQQHIDSNSTEVHLSSSRSASSSLEYTVEGHLDSDELKALDKLVKDVTKLANEFFDGDINKAFQQTAALSFNTEELQSFSLNLKQSATISSIETYRQIASLDEGLNEPSNISNADALARVNDFIQELRDMETRHENDQPFEDSLKLFHDVFKEAINHEQRFLSAGLDKQESIEDTVENLISENP